MDIKYLFYYSVMKSGKTDLLAKFHNDLKRAKKEHIVLVPERKDRVVGEFVTLNKNNNNEVKALVIGKDQNIEDIVNNTQSNDPIYAILVDEAQFLTEKQVIELSNLVDYENIIVACYGLRIDSNGKLFDGSRALFRFADELKEIESLCHCGQKATMVLRFNKNGDIIKNGRQVVLGSDDKYISVCRTHWKENDIGLDNEDRDDYFF